MSLKGKEKAVGLDASNAQADVDDDLDSFFVKKPKRKQLPRHSPVRSPSPVLILDDSDEEEGAKPRLKKAKPKRSGAANRLPEWTRIGSHDNAKKRQRSAGRGSTEERKTSGKLNEAITIESSPEKENGSPKGELELTPPPELTEAKKAEIAHAVLSAVSRRPAAEDVASSSTESTVRPATAAVDDVVKGHFRMVASPDKRANESEKDVERYERVRSITMSKTQPLSYAISALASQIRRAAGDVIVTFNGDKLYSTSLTPQSLGIDYDADFVCYEKEYYDRIQAEARERRRRADAETQSADEEANEGEGHASQSSEPAEEISDKARITLVGESGPVYYLKRTQQDKSLLDSLRLSLDGEIIEPSTPFSDMGIDNGDQIDVVKV